MGDARAFGLIAGGGRLPFLVAEGARHAGFKVICVGFEGSVDPQLAGSVDVFYTVSVARLGVWIRKLRRHCVSDTAMVGRIDKTKLFTRWRIIKNLPDWRILRVFYWRLRGKSLNTDLLLSAVADELATGGIIVTDSTVYCKEHLASEGVLTHSQPSSETYENIERGWTIAKKLGELDIGQAVIVKEKEVIAVEAIEGTAEMIKRAGRFCPAGGWVLVKTSKPNQDMRFDVPCIGPDTIKGIAEFGGRCVVVEANKTIIIDKPDTLELANKLGITIVAR
jgi:UDP-2,3-diacylglucosamine hydrolase